MKKKLKKIFTSKKFIIVLSLFLAIYLFGTFAMPHIILAIVRQPKPEDHPYSEYFLTTYDEVRNNLANRVASFEESGIESIELPSGIEKLEHLAFSNCPITFIIRVVANFILLIFLYFSLKS